MLAFKDTPGSFAKGVDRQALAVIHEAVITIANQIRLRALEEDGLPKPFERFRYVFPAVLFILVFEGGLEELFFDGFVSRDSRFDGRLCKL